MRANNFNSEECLERLHKIAAEIPSGVREDAFKSILQVECSHELFSTTSGNIVSVAKQFIDDFWKDFNIAEKLKDLKTLDENSGKEDDTWRPVTGVADIKPSIATVLRERRDKLEQEIKAVREESAALQLELKNYADKINKQNDEMDSFNFISSNENL